MLDSVLQQMFTIHGNKIFLEGSRYNQGLPTECTSSHRVFKVKDIRTSNVITINESAPLIDVFRVFKQKIFNALPVFSDSGKLVGISTVYDILSSLMSS
jgi:CBS domain-containing protein